MRKLYNKTQERVVATKCVTAETFFARLKGLLGRKQLDKGECLYIKPCNSIHTCFMEFSIDVVFLDKQLKVVKIIYNIKPWRATPFVKEAYSVIEFPGNSIDEEFRIYIGDQLEFIESD